MKETKKLVTVQAISHGFSIASQLLSPSDTSQGIQSSGAPTGLTQEPGTIEYLIVSPSRKVKKFPPIKLCTVV